MTVTETAATTGTGLQPLLHDAVALLRAPTQAWSAADGDMGEAAIHGLYHSDTRVLDRLELRVGDARPEPIGSVLDGASSARFSAVVRGVGEPTADPRVRVDRVRSVVAGRLEERIRVSSSLEHPLQLPVTLLLGVDFSAFPLVKAGQRDPRAAPAAHVDGAAATWRRDAVSLRVQAEGGALRTQGSEVAVTWNVHVPAGGRVELVWSAAADDAAAVVAAAQPADWSALPTPLDEPRLARWQAQALADLDALRMTRAGESDTFLAAGAPWFFTLFGRDSIWAARMLLPLDVPLAMSTLRTLAGLQGAKTDASTAEAPGKIMHELRPTDFSLPGEGVQLPPLYFGTVDATPLWISLLHDAWSAGAPEDEVRALMPALRRALAWMRDDGAREDGFLAYHDAGGTGLANQGWKDSGDSIQWRDGRLADGPIALSEVQGYAYEAAIHGAELLERLGDAVASEAAGWREWADALRERFRARFWLEDADGRYPAIALDAHGAPVDAVASNMGHLLGSGILSPDEAAAIARRLVSPALNSGFGLRTLAEGSAGFWPLGYHTGSVWTHDTAIAITGLLREGFRDEARLLAAGLVEAAEKFDYRMPELHSGDARADVAAPAPYPAACRPQAWSAAAVVPVIAAYR
ncbi:glycogen debranching N-terminal domain-containing protein [Gryllotalpicola reticulitermitis]|uniref:Glycogen debranching N-terminal domain-containing protein n=1 Tax=Gryllotalpicola reticulitermitis TaxID=1184153 RepID=A0ABV8Q8R3_9MICO